MGQLVFASLNLKWELNKARLRFAVHTLRRRQEAHFDQLP